MKVGDITTVTRRAAASDDVDCFCSVGTFAPRRMVCRSRSLGVGVRPKFSLDEADCARSGLSVLFGFSMFVDENE